MGRGGGGRGRGGSGGDKVEALFEAIQVEKVDTVRWSFQAGGIPLNASNEYGQTPLMVAAAGGKEMSLDIILQQVRRLRGAKDRSEILDATDEESQTALMMACARNRFGCVKMLKEAGAWLLMKDANGYTARDRADYVGNKKIVELLDGLRTEEDDSEPDSAAESEGGFEGETSTQRSKRKKREKEAGGTRGGNLTCAASRKEKEAVAKVVEDNGAPQKTPTAGVGSIPEPVLPEIAEALAAAAAEDKRSGSLKELTLSLVRTEEEQLPGLAPGCIDPALWRCGLSLRHLVIRWRPGLKAATLDSIGALKRLLHLIVQDSGLPELPDSISELKELRSLEVDGNVLKDFPSSIATLSGTLETISAARNKLNDASLKRLAPLTKLVSLKLDSNTFTDLQDLNLSDKPHLVTLSVAHNKLSELPAECWEKLAMLQHLNVSDNKLTELPCAMGALKEKKFTELIMDDNPWKDGKIRSMIENSAVLSTTVLVYLRKIKPTGKKGSKPKGKPKRKAKAGSDSEGGEGSSNED